MDQLQTELKLAEEGVEAKQTVLDAKDAELLQQRVKADEHASTAKAQHEKFAEEAVVSQKEMARLDAQVGEYTTEICRLKDDLESERKKIGEMEDAVEMLQITSSRKAEQVTSLTEAAAEQAETTRVLKEELQALEANYAQAITEQSKGELDDEAKSKEMTTLTKKLDAQLELATQLETELSDATVKIGEVTGQYQDALRAQADQQASLNDNTECIQKLRTELEGKNDDLGTKQNALDDAMLEVQTMSARAETVDMALVEAENKVKVMEQALEDESITHQEEIAEIMKELELSHATTMSLREQLLKATASQARLEGECAEADTKIKALENASVVLKKDYEQLQASLKDLEAEKHSVVESADAGASQLATLRTELDASKRRVGECSTLLTEAEAAREAKTEEIAKLKDQVKALIDADVEIQQARDDLAAERVEQDQVFAQVQKELDEFKSSAQANIQELQDVQQALKTTVAAQTAEINKLVANSDALQNRYAMSEVNLDAALEDAEALVHELERTQTCEATAHKEKEQYKSKLEQLQEEKMISEEALVKSTLQVEKLQKELDKLTGHQNIHQKIQLHLQIKKENNALKQELAKMKTQLRNAARIAGSPKSGTTKPPLAKSAQGTKGGPSKRRISDHTNVDRATIR